MIKKFYKIFFIICCESNPGAPLEGEKAISEYWRGIQYRRYREMVMCSNDKIDCEFFPQMYQALNNKSI